MSGICDTNKSIPDSSSRLTTVPKAGFFDITGLPTKLEANQAIYGSSDNTIQYNEKIDTSVIPFLKYNDLASETGTIWPIATASAVIRTEPNSFVVFYPSYYNASATKKDITETNQVTIEDTSGNNQSLPTIQVQNDTKIPNVSFNGNKYTIYIIPSNKSMSGGGVQHGGSIAAYNNLFTGAELPIADINRMLMDGSDHPSQVSVPPPPPPTPTVASKYIVAQKPNLYFNAGAEQRFTLQNIFGRNVDPTKVSFMCSFVGIEGDNIVGGAMNNFRANLDCNYDGREISILYKSWDSSKLKQCGVTLTAFAIPILSGGNYKIKYSV